MSWATGSAGTNAAIYDTTRGLPLGAFYGASTVSARPQASCTCSCSTARTSTSCVRGLKNKVLKATIVGSEVELRIDRQGGGIEGAAGLDVLYVDSDTASDRDCRSSNWNCDGAVDLVDLGTARARLGRPTRPASRHRGLNIRHVAWKRGEISYSVHPDYWGQGIASEIARLLCQFGFEELALERVEATCDPRNSASAAVLKRIGMTYEGVLRRTVLIRSGWRDSKIHSLIRPEWTPPPRTPAPRWTLA